MNNDWIPIAIERTEESIFIVQTRNIPDIRECPVCIFMRKQHDIHPGYPYAFTHCRTRITTFKHQARLLPKCPANIMCKEYLECLYKNDFSLETPNFSEIVISLQAHIINLKDMMNS